MRPRGNTIGANVTPESLFLLPGYRAHLTGQRARRGAKSKGKAKVRNFIKPENAAGIAGAISGGEFDYMHCVIPGNFVYGDLIGTVVDSMKPESVIVTTLSMSRKNVRMFSEIAKSVESLRIMVSSYWINTDKERAAELLCSIAEKNKNTECRETRIHTKICIIDDLVMEGSANLRSSNCLEQFTASTDPLVAAFHRKWIHEVWEKSATLKPMEIKK